LSERDHVIFINNTKKYVGLTSHPGQLSLVIPPWVGPNEYTGDGLLDIIKVENGESCVTAETPEAN